MAGGVGRLKHLVASGSERQKLSVIYKHSECLQSRKRFTGCQCKWMVSNICKE